MRRACVIAMLLLPGCASKLDTRQAREIYVPTADAHHLQVDLKTELYVPLAGADAPPPR